MQPTQYHLMQLVFAKQNQQFQQLRKRLTQRAKYFFSPRRSVTIIYDPPLIYVIQKQYLKIIDLRKDYNINEIVYNYKRGILLFNTIEGRIYIYFTSSKIIIEVRKEYKKIMLLQWIYGFQQSIQFLICEQQGIHLYKIDQQKKIIKQIKYLQGKYHCYLYQYQTQFLIGFRIGQPNIAYTFIFQSNYQKNGYKAGKIRINFQIDQTIIDRMKGKKRSNIQGTRIGKQLFIPRKTEDYFLDIQLINQTPYLIFYSGGEGKLQLTPLTQSDKQSVIIKLPSDCPPRINVYDNMLLIHLPAEKISFIYDILPNSSQALVPPFCLINEDNKLDNELYNYEFTSKRVIGHNFINKWKLNLNAIYYYLKPQMQIFEFLYRRDHSKIQLIKWIRQNIFILKQINLSKIWKTIFNKIICGLFDQSQIVSIIQIYTNIFYTLSIDNTINKNYLLNILIECLRQAIQCKIIIPIQLQIFTADLLLQCQKYDLLSFLCYQQVLSGSLLAMKIYQQAIHRKEDLLLTLSIDLATQFAQPLDIFTLIIKSQRLKEAKRFIKANLERIDPIKIISVCAYIMDPLSKQEFLHYLCSFIEYNCPKIDIGLVRAKEKEILS